MGCITSKHTIDPWRLEDSVHVALNRDKKKGGNAPINYIPRAPHPLLMAKQYPNIVVDDSTMKLSCCESDEGGADAEAERILELYANHCDTVDPRDLPSTRVKCC
jgi:hypothetical protein